MNAIKTLLALLAAAALLSGCYPYHPHGDDHDDHHHDGRQDQVQKY